MPLDIDADVAHDFFFMVAKTGDDSPAVALLSADETTELWGVSQSGVVTAAGFAPNTVPTVTGSKAGNAALTSLIAALAGMGLITDTTT